MSDTLTRDDRWKLHVHNGWQILVTCEEDDERGDWGVTFALAANELDVSIRIGSPNEEVARKLFAAATDGEKAYETLRKYAPDLEE